jgi:3-oxoadipate enol-lactonase
MLEETPLEGYLGCSAAIREADLRHEVAGIAAPTLVITGAHDPATPPEQGRWLAGKVPGASYAALQASHLSNIEAADHFNAELVGFLGGSATRS